MKKTDLEIIDTKQDIYDSFNSFIMSEDIKIFGKLLARQEVFNKVKKIPGDIVECGVFKGSGIYSFLKLKRYLCPNTYKKVIGFDMFNSKELVESLNQIDKQSMSSLFEFRNFEHNDKFKHYLETKIKSHGFLDHEFELIEGDISVTSKQYIDENPGFRISLLYMDLDLSLPTLYTLENFWDRLSKGGIVVFDEYAYGKWSESCGVDEFFADKNVQIISMDYICPTAYVIKD